jgi:phage baseplate assembly protein V
VIDAIRRLLKPLHRRVMLLVGRGVVRLAQDTPKVQTLQVELLAKEVRDRVERFQEYGFTNVPHPGAEVVVVCIGGNRDHAIAIATEDRRYRPTGLKPGQTEIYDSSGTRILLGADGTVEVLAAKKVTVKCPLVRIEGNLEVTGEITDRAGAEGTSMEFIRNRFNQHVHSNPEGGNVGPAAPQFD